MDLLLRLGDSRTWHELDVRLEGAVMGSDLGNALVAAGLIKSAELDALRLDRCGTKLNTQVPLGDLGLRRGDLLTVVENTTAPGSAATDPGATIVVASGVDAGRSMALPSTGVVAGRSASADLTVEDSGLSREHFRITLSEEGTQVEDLHSRNGTFHLGTRITETPHPVIPDLPVEAGNSAFRVMTRSNAADPPHLRTHEGFAEFNRGPRAHEPDLAVTFMLSAPPGDRPPRRIPILTSLAPLLLAPVFVFAGGGLGYLAIVLLSPVLLLASWWEDRRHGGKDYANDVEKFRRAVASTTRAMREQRQLECLVRWRTNPDPAEALARTAPTAQLWERRISASDFLTMRVGWSDLPTRMVLDFDEGGLDSLREEAHAQLAPLLSAPAVPVTVSLREVGSLGVSGSPVDVAALARWLMFQLAVLHSPRDLLLGAVVSSDESWSWLARLPHARWEGGEAVVTGTAAGRDLMDRVTRTVESRVAASKSTENHGTWPDVVVLVEEAAELPRNLVTSVLEDGPGVGVHLIWACDTVAAVPGQCGGIVSVTGSSVALTVETAGQLVDDASVDSIPLNAVRQASWSLVGLRDASSRDQAAAIPNAVPLAKSLEMPVPTPAVLIRRWAGATGLGAPIGMDANGPHWIDLRDDGPHALLGGTTGAGKSELLQTLVVSLAATHSPQRLTFLLVDYKGGAAFKDCVQLPHTVGYVTDLDGHLVSRVLVSLHAELNHREHQLASVGAKDLLDMERRHPELAPPSLLLVVDEFAALATELPDFVDGMVNLAQRGRSLGMHLLLATQRPAGAINDNIRANTNLRMSLRMNDRRDSEDVIDSPVAAALPRSLPGRAFIRTGAAQLAEVQIAYSGGRSFGDHLDRTSVTVSVHGQTPTTAVRPVQQLHQGGAHAESDLQQLVRTIETTAAGAGLPAPRRPWLPPLPDLISVNDLPPDEGWAVTVGRRDEPHRQAQAAHVVDLVDSGGLLVAGSSGSGKTTMLRTLAGRLAERHGPEAMHLYGIDFGSRGLSPLTAMPQCGGVVFAEDTARVVRAFQMLDAAIKARRLAMSRAEVTTYEDLIDFEKAHSEPVTPRIVVLLDGYASFAQAFEKVEYGAWIERLPTSIAEGRTVGIHWAVTTERRLAVPAAVMATLPQRLVLRFHDHDEYESFGLDRTRTKDVDLPVGRGFSQDSDEVQLAVYGADGAAATQVDALADLAGRLAIRYTDSPRVPPVRLLPEVVDRSTVVPAGVPGELVALPVGVRDLSFEAATVDLLSGGLLIAGARRSGKSSALIAIVEALVDAGRATPVKLTLVAPRATPLLDLNVWGSVHRNAASAEDAIDELLLDLESQGPDDPWLVWVVDDAHEYLDELLDDRLATLAARGAEHRLRVVAAGDRVTAQRAYGGLMRHLRAERSGLVLQPDPDMDSDLFDAPIDRRHRGGPPGRAILVRQGEASLIQVFSATAEESRLEAGSSHPTEPALGRPSDPDRSSTP